MSLTPARTATRLLLATGLLVAAGCAAAGPPIRPADLPFHASAPAFFTLHWRLDREDGTVAATGLVDVAGADRFADAVLELQGLDRAGRVVSRGQTLVRPMAFSPDEPWPFTVRLRLQGREDRFAVHVSHYTWKPIRGTR